MPSRDLKDDIRLLTRAASSHIVTLPAAALALGLPPRSATIRMARLVANGWARRIRRGVFLLIPANAPQPEGEAVHDPEALAAALFAPCYLGGWSAAAKWRLSHVKRIGIFVVTASRVRRSSVRLEGFRYHLVHAPRSRVEGIGILRTGHHGTPISDDVRTIVDALCCPAWLGGTIYLGDALKAHRYSDDWDEDYFTDVVAAIGTGAAHKRLGMLLEMKGLPTYDLRRQAVKARTSGVVDLDPGLPSRGPIHTFWGVRRNTDLVGWELPEEDAVEDDYIEGVDDIDP